MPFLSRLPLRLRLPALALVLLFVGSTLLQALGAESAGGPAAQPTVRPITSSLKDHGPRSDDGLPAAAQPVAAESVQAANRIKHRLPDFSNGRAGVLGPFFWGRAMDVGEDARFSDAEGRPQRDGEHLWLFNFNRTAVSDDPRGLNSTFIHARSNFVIRHPDLGFIIQPKRFLHHTSGAHNSKIAIGYVPEDFRFEHGDNCDLEHLADAPRVVVFIPVRHRGNIPNPLDQSAYFVNPHYSAQTPCVIEFEPGEIILYDWFRNPEQLHERILFDLQPHLAREPNFVRPGVTHPLIRFDLVPERKGGWILRIQRDGRDGIVPERDEDWDLVVTDQSPGARPFSVDLDPAKSAWALSLFSPGGAPAETSEIVLGLKPYHRADGKPAPWPNRTDRIRTTPIERLPPSTPAAGRRP